MPFPQPTAQKKDIIFGEHLKEIFVSSYFVTVLVRKLKLVEVVVEGQNFRRKQGCACASLNFLALISFLLLYLAVMYFFNILP